MKSFIELARVTKARDMAPRGGTDKDRAQHHILMSAGVGHLTQRDCCRGKPNGVEMAPCLPGLRLKLLNIKVAKLLSHNKPQDREGIGVSLVVHTECK